MTGSELIANERVRQVLVEGWTAEHDAEHDQGEMAIAAYGYMLAADLVRRGYDWTTLSPPPEWPWDATWFKPSDDPIVMLVKAGALIAAEIDRLQRAGKPLPDCVPEMGRHVECEHVKSPRWGEKD